MKNIQQTTNSEQRACGAFTLIELVVAVALFAIVFAFTGMIFKVCINSYRITVANTEIIQKLRAVTDQLNADFKGLRKDGEILVVWMAEPGSHERFDRIMFFADGDFQSYGLYKNGILDPSGDPVRGSVARICYMLASKPPPYANIGTDAPVEPGNQKPEKRILARTQHILTADAQFAGSPLTPDVTSIPLDRYYWNDVNEYDYDMNSLDKWKNVPWAVSGVNKSDMLTVIVGSTDVTVGSSTINVNIRGTMAAPVDANLIHNILCEGVGEFKVQSWYDAKQRWVPEWDNGDFYPEGSGTAPGVLYPYRAWLPPFPYVEINGGITYPNQLIDETHFNEIPGLGRALKFTFTLYDSKGVFKKGRTFTHIVYIGN
jgi:prepilin-type N-terminal cleavage/methylation domain-containing protein